MDASAKDPPETSRREALSDIGEVMAVLASYAQVLWHAFA